MTTFMPFAPAPLSIPYGFEMCYGLHVSDVGEDGDVLLRGHPDPRYALAAVRAHLRAATDPAEASDRMRNNVELTYLWAVQVEHCATYPLCGSVGDGSDGLPCHDGGQGYTDHAWERWHTILPPPERPDRPPIWLRGCERCDLTEYDPPREPHNPCTQCLDVDDTPWYYQWAGVTADTPGAFPITLWRA